MKFFYIFPIAVQLFTYADVRFLLWLYRVVSPKKRKAAYIGAFVFGNGLIAVWMLLYQTWLLRIVSLWLVSLLFMLFTAVIIIALSLACRRLFRQPERSGAILRLLAPAVFAAFFGWAVYNAYTPVVRHAHITLHKPLAKPLRIGMAADTHLGILVGARQLDKLAGIMQREQVDVILLPGDIMDDDTAAYEAENMKPHLQKLRAPLGVYATLGNHDLFGHEREITRAIEDAGIRVLHDEAVLVDNRFWVAGRPDKLDKQRKPAAQLLQQTDPAQPVFLLDHRPDEVEAHAQLPIDIQVSGHVHNGQIFPANYIVRAINRLAYGYENINGRHFFVTSGYGFWGVPLRLGSQSEVWIIDVDSDAAAP